MGAKLRLIEFGRIALHPGGEFAHVAHILCPLPPGKRAPAPATLRFASGRACGTTVSALPRSVLLRRGRERAEFERLSKTEQRIGIVERHLRGVFLRGSM